MSGTIDDPVPERRGAMRPAMARVADRQKARAHRIERRLERID